MSDESPPLVKPVVHFDAFLTDKVQEFLSPTGEVWKLVMEDGKEQWVLDLRNGEPEIGIGPNFSAARASINTMIRSKKAMQYQDENKEKA